MFKRIKILLVIVSLSITLCLMSNTYSRYVASTTSNVDMILAKWQILVNTIDITNRENSNITFTPIITPNENVANNVFAPSSEGYFDIDINPTNVDVSFKYNVNLSVNNQNMLDLKMTDYSLIPVSYTSGELAKIPVNHNVITNSLYYNNEIQNFRFESFTLRIYFKWLDGNDEQMNDDADTNISRNDKITINANITFEQIINETNQEPVVEN